MSSKQTTPSLLKLSDYLPEDEIARSLAVSAYLFAHQAARFPATSVATANKRYDTQMIEGGVKIVRTLNMSLASFNSMKWSDLQEQFGYQSSEAKSIEEMIRVTKANAEKAERMAKDCEEQVANAEKGAIPVEQMPNVLELREKAASLRASVDQAESVVHAYETKLKPVAEKLKAIQSELDALKDAPKVPETKIWELKFADFPVLL